MIRSARNGTASAISLILIASAASRGAIAQEIGGLAGPRANDNEAPAYVVLNSRLERSDNVRRVSDGEESDTLASLGLGINYGYAGPRLSAVALGDLSYVEYLDNTYSGRLAGNFDGQAIWGKNTDLLQWQLEDVFGQTRTDALASATPDNLQNVNVISTGPTINLRFGQTFVALDGRYADQSYESGDLDSRRLTGAASVGRSLSEKSSLSLNAQVERLKYDDSVGNADYDTRQYFVRYRSELGRNNISSDLGYTEVEIDGSKPSGGALARVDIDRRISASSSVFIGGRMQFSSSADALRMDRGSTGSRPDSEAPLAASDPFRQREVIGGWRTERSRTSLTLSASRSEERYEKSTQLDRDVTQLQVELGRHIAPTLWLRTEARYQKEEFVNVDAAAKELTLSAELRKSLGRKVSLSLRYEYNDHSGNGGAAEYKENLIMLYFDFLAAGRR